jgi:regulatory protein YycI of two-component signal transduction system YycFG
VDWSKIKTIFILTFLVLDVYLMYQYMIIRDSNKYGLLTEASFEDKLKADEIEYVVLPKQPIKDQYVSAKPKSFSKDEVTKLKGQTITIVDGTMIQSIFDKTVQLTAKNEQTEIKTLLKEFILNGEEYQFGYMDDKKNTITYYQQYKNRPFYNNINGKLTFYLSKDKTVVSYEQTYLDGIEELTGKEEILSPLKAIETLHQKGLLKPKSKVTKIEFGYSTLVQLAASQVLTPTWQIVVDSQESLFVNAFEGQIIQFNTEENNIVE